MSTDPRTRLRGNFSEVLQRQIAELTELAREAISDSAVMDALRGELVRIRGTAEALGVEDVEEAAAAAIAACDDGVPVEGLERFAAAARQLGPSAALLRPIVLVQIDAAELERYAWILRRVDNVSDALLLADQVSAYVAPVDVLPHLLAGMSGFESPVPIFAVGPRYDLTARVAAAEQGATGYLSEPLEISALLARVRTRGDALEQLPYRILLIEPEGRNARQLIRCLEGPDRSVRWLRDGGDLLETLDDFWPELLVLSSNAGSVSGLSLMSVVRGHQHFADLPILMVASAEDLKDASFQAAADDILLKPLSATLFRARVQARLKRLRSVRFNQELDSTTGCLSRAALLRAVDREIGRSRRTGAVLSAALIDVDGLRSLSDEAGAGVGDRVLRGLSEILGRTLRHTDVVGRIGADSFALLLPGCGVDDARRRVELVRERFRGWTEIEGLGALDFSAGVADTTGQANELLARAGRALHGAREAGGGRTVKGI